MSTKGTSKMKAPMTVDHSNMKLGKRHARHDPRVPMLARYTVSLPAPPAHVDYAKKVTSWPMMLNNKLGDCTCAAVGHVIAAGYGPLARFASPDGTNIALIFQKP